MARAVPSMYSVAGLLLGASIVRYAGQLAMLVYIARFLDAGSVGIYTLALAICAPIYIVAGFGMRTVHLTLRYTIRPAGYERFLLTSLAAAYVVVAVVGTFVPREITVALLVIAGIRTAELFMDLYDAMLQRSKRPGIIVGVVASGTVLQVLVTGGVFLLGGSLVQALLASLAVYGLNLVLIARPVAVRSARRLDSPDPVSATPWRHIFAAGLPTGISVGMVTLLSTVPQYLLGQSGNVADAGRFAVFLYVVVATEMLLNALSQSWIPHARQLRTEGRLTPRAVLRTSLRWIGICSTCGLIALGAAALLLPIILGPAYTLTLQIAIPLAIVICVVPVVFSASAAIFVHNGYAMSMLVSITSLVLGTAVGLGLVAAGRFDLTVAFWLLAFTMTVRAVGGFVSVLILTARASQTPAAPDPAVPSRAAAPNQSAAPNRTAAPNQSGGHR